MDDLDFATIEICEHILYHYPSAISPATKTNYGYASQTPIWRLPSPFYVGSSMGDTGTERMVESRLAGGTIEYLTYRKTVGPCILLQGRSQDT